jgi:hypothetical protein
MLQVAVQRIATITDFARRVYVSAIPHMMGLRAPHVRNPAFFFICATTALISLSVYSLTQPSAPTIAIITEHAMVQLAYVMLGILDLIVHSVSSFYHSFFDYRGQDPIVHDSQASARTDALVMANV